MRLALLIGVVASIATISVNALPYGSGDESSLETVIDSVNTFSLNFLKIAAGEHKNKLICAPIGVSTVLSMAYNGAAGNTKEQMRKGLALPKDDAVTKEGFQSMIAGLKKFRTVQLHLASRIFVDDGVQLQSSFKQLTKEVFSSEVQSLDFDNSVLASKAINKWSEDNTNGIIKDLVKPADVGSNTPLVLATAVYFNGAWAAPFEKENTTNRPFYINAKDTINIPTMHQNTKFPTGDLPTLDARFIELPYQSNSDEISMFIILPNTVDGLAKVIENLPTFSPSDLLDSKTAERYVYLPKFRISSELSLQNTLQKMQMTDMFDGQLSNFSGIFGSRSLTISKIVQKAFIDVNEKGSEAAASTYDPFMDRIGSAPSEFRVDRPFLAIIASIAPKPTILFAATWSGRNE